MPSTATITRETVLCVSVAARPSNLGTRFHNFLYDELGLDFLYKAFAPSDIGGAVAGVRALGIRGCSVSMPFKETCIPLVDELDESAAAIQSVNTIVNTDGHLRAYNTDYRAVAQLLDIARRADGPSSPCVGSGGMAKAVVAALRDGGFTSGTVVARNADAAGARRAVRLSRAAPRSAAAPARV